MGQAVSFYNWFKLDTTDAPNAHIKLGVLPDSIVAKTSNTNSSDYKKAETLKENIAFKVVNPKYIEANEK